jgi:hypothetical protein
MSRTFFSPDGHFPQWPSRVLRAVSLIFVIDIGCAGAVGGVADAVLSAERVFDLGVDGFDGLMPGDFEEGAAGFAGNAGGACFAGCFETGKDRWPRGAVKGGSGRRNGSGKE